MNIFARYRVSMIKTVCGRGCTQTTPMTDNDANNDNDDDDANDT